MLPVILSGGAGTRLWPISRPDKPKQFLPLIDAQTMIQQTIARISGLDFMSAPLVICNEQHLSLVQSQLAGIADIRIMLEPVGRNTAPAITAAALYCEAHEQDGLMLVLSSDHVIKNKDAFQKAVAAARLAAMKNKYALFGIVPTHAETGYGYIETEIMASSHALTVKAFKEKPDAATAKKYVSQKNYFWNSGMFTIPAKLFLTEIAQFEPHMHTLVKAAYEHAAHSNTVIKLDATSFEKIKGTSIDYAVMEHTKNAVVIPLDAGWSDVGSWNSVWEFSQKDNNGNAATGNVFFKNAHNNLVRTENSKPIMLLGMQDCIVIESNDVLLIADKHAAQEVKSIAELFTKK
ncbi:MAG: mannose-1-phosphate guanylyltransferase/mannose-6-phosphate isomerase [Treponema sp.]|nr:mannose-1-phosphate guanylyltransferase/mannose-6-phosphate isomerase [Treponema sp.]